MNFLAQWAFAKELRELQKKLEATEKALEEANLKIAGQQAVIDYAKDLHESMFAIIQSFAPKPLAEVKGGAIGGAKSWQTVRKELEKKAAER